MKLRRLEVMKVWKEEDMKRRREEDLLSRVRNLNLELETKRLIIYFWIKFD